jgi:long-chain acyl-CoA synthetase
VRAHLTGYKVPRQVFVMDALPTSMIGKVLHRQVRQHLLDHPDRRTAE